ncbi:MAG TPA: excinuclease ABC subunit UvrA [Candidatus Cloacimonadota bacterium]|nr:excinuclease ABC subunit UvrA [Candidatus Cloacimonadota bacterium]HQB41936.1 excinuclease ABC subunit UvrA [Candidatus Cloacimonadota bacterium]
MKDKIVIKGASEHNLKHIHLSLNRNELIVFTGVSGSGKSSLAFDTLYAEGQRRYVESLSAYARQFLGQMEKPKVDYIEGLSPAISIDQKAASKNPRSTVGTVTEIYDYLRILFARTGTQYCHICGDEISSQTIDQMVQRLISLPERTKIQILSPLVQNRKGEHKDELDYVRKEGFTRVVINGQVRELNEDIVLDKKSKHNIDVLIDRIVIKEGVESRIADSIETGLKLANGVIKIDYPDENVQEIMSEHNSCPKCNTSYPDLLPQHFSFNSPLGMCPVCNGLGTKLEFDPDLIIIDKTLSINEGAIVPWGKMSEKQNSWSMGTITKVAEEYGFSLDTPWNKLSEDVQNVLLYGTKGKRYKVKWSSNHGAGEYMVKFSGIIPTLERRMHETNSEGMKQWYMQFISDKPCPKCDGKKLKDEFLAVRINGQNIADLTEKTIASAYDFFNKLDLKGNQKIIAEDVLKEIKNRLSFLNNVGLHYLSMARRSPTLSGGESQRIRLASQIGSGLVGVMYILDEPSIGLHQRDNQRLIEMLLHLRDLGNTVIVVEHDEEMMRTADTIVDFGPNAGINGGRIVACGNINEVINTKESLTGQYLSGALKIEMPEKRRALSDEFLKIKGARRNNLKNINVDIPLGLFVCVTGVSGSGKSSLVNQILYPAAAKALNRANVLIGEHDSISGFEYLDKVIDIDQQPIGRTPRSNPATYIKVFDLIRDLFSELPAAKIKGYKPGRFSFNVKGGRCEACQGAGVKLIEMHFLADVYVTCEVCKGKRYNSETLSVRYKGKNISDILDMDVQESYELFENIPSINKKLQTLIDVGLGYIKLGQLATTLSGGEAQRIKLARELSKTSTGQTLYILDEPTTGLHFDDINKLLVVLQRLVDMGNSVIVIEHNLDVIKCADYIIDLGPEGGDGGGKVISKGTPEQVAKSKVSATGKYLKDVLVPHKN